MTKINQSTNSAISLVRREDVEFFISLFREFDDDYYPFLRQAQIPNDILDPKASYKYLPETTLKNLILVLGSRLSTSDFGHLIATSCSLNYVPKFISQLTCEGSLKEVLEEFSLILKTASSDANVYPVNAGGKWWLIRDKNNSDELWFKYGEMFAITFLCELLKVLTKGAWKPIEIGIQTDRDDEFSLLPELAQTQFYCCRPTTALHIPDEIMAMPITFARASNFDNPPPIPSCDTFLDSFKLAMIPYISMGKLPIKIASEILNMNVRTIQRRFSDQGSTYSEVIESMVLTQILDLLKCDQLPITDIASKMGYSDSAHFTRAFKRLMHMTPREYKKKLKNKTL
ncbi:helix-turn-helix domain-containing protein [Vibrio sp. ZSDE26]|uniref:Helix-turn-helix domain-containing protein n=1 Tax=Vibrio amylolyticus TaxID=2847292 RepID=A0A9X1XQ58_9VIBR|nr:helix-turn-helix domain-containing protein [Vibrio amylolyticus]MCK6263529.1 helix-turn-helix domain-containing protein [Vibrio amylolyticus]